MQLTIELASQLARLPLACLSREYPHKLDHVMDGDADVQPPRTLHPAFFGCFDWHSAVHGHWMLVRLLRRFPALPEGPRIRALLDATLTRANLEIEAAYVARRPLFERMYGWAWLLQLATELHGFDERLAANVEPLAGAITAHAVRFLPRQAYPVRTGVHANTAFALGLMLDHARALGNAPLEALVVERATAYFAGDEDYPAHLEPGGEDFLSPALTEADLMRRVVPDFAAWLARFFPRGLPAVLAAPVHLRATDRSDGKLAHLDGLNLSRAWCLRALGFEDAAAAHARAGLAHVATGDYAGEHWLATFATYLLA